MAVEKIVNIKVKDNADKSAKNFKNLNKEVKQTETTTKDTSKATEDLGRTTDTVTGGMVGKFKGLLTSVRGVISSFGLLKTAIIATGLGALLIAIVSIKQAFTSSEEGQNRWAKVMGVVGAIVGNFVDLLSDLGDLLIWVFTHPKEAIMSFTKALKENIINRFTGLLELIPALGKAVSKLFSGDFKEAGKIAANAVGKVALGVENVTEKINDATEATKAFIEEQIREAEIASKIADQRAKADKQERALITERALADRDIADLRAKAEERDIYNVSQRIKFLKDANDLEESITKKEIETAKLRRDAIIEENKLTKSNKEALQAEEEAKAKVIQLETSYLRAKKRLTTQIQTLTREEAAARKAAYDAEVAANDEKNAKKLEADRKHLEEMKKLAEQEIELQDKQYDLLQEVTNSEYEQEIYQLTKQYDAKFELAMGNAELEKALEEKQKADIKEIRDKYRQQEIDAEKAASDKKKADDEKALAEAKALSDKKYKMAYDTINALSSLNDLFNAKNEKDARAQFKINKALSLAQASIQTFQAVTGALTAGGNPIKLATGAQFIEAGIAAAVGGANIAKIAATQFGGFGDKSTSTSNVSTSSIDSSIKQLSSPNFNVVGASGISQTENLQPVKAYVVSGDVTTAQALDRNRIQNATF